MDPLWVKPRLRRAAALRSLDRKGEARQEYERVARMEDGCKLAHKGLRDCMQDRGELYNHIFNFLKVSFKEEEELED